MIGPTLGGFITTYASWHWIFLLNLPFCLLAFVLGAPFAFMMVRGFAEGEARRKEVPLRAMLGDKVFDAFKFYILDTPAGIMQVHGYPYSEQASTFILEMHEDVWRRAGFGWCYPYQAGRFAECEQRPAAGD